MARELATSVHVDGYNLYYGRLRGTPYKWLDLVALFEHVLHDQDPRSNLSRLRLYSAPALARFARHGQASVEAQQDYHRALLRLHAPRLSVVLGNHSFDRKGTLLPRYIDGAPYDRSNRIRVWKLEEKKTDVNLALALYRDASSGAFGQLIVCSNDSDIEPALEAVRTDFPDIAIGVVTPRPPPKKDGRPHRNVTSSLSRHADWTRQHLRDDELARAQLPTRVRAGKPIGKPVHW